MRVYARLCPPMSQLGDDFVGSVIVDEVQNPVVTKSLKQLVTLGDGGVRLRDSGKLVDKLVVAQQFLPGEPKDVVSTNILKNKIRIVGFLFSQGVSSLTTLVS